MELGDVGAADEYEDPAAAVAVKAGGGGMQNFRIASPFILQTSAAVPERVTRKILWIRQLMLRHLLQSTATRRRSTTPVPVPQGCG
jgi:hypothetical protein